MLPSGFSANVPLLTVWPVSVCALTAPSLPATAAAALAPIAVSELMAVPPAQPPPPSTWTRRFQFAAVGNQTSMPMPAEVDGASAGPGFPGPTLSLTRHTSLAASAGGGDAGVSGSASGSPLANALTNVTFVSALGL